MNNLVTDVKSLELETLKNLKSSKSNNTLRAYKADFRDFALFFENMQKMNYQSKVARTEDVNIELGDIADPELDNELLMVQ